MKKYNFDEVVNRHGTSCIKVDFLEQTFGTEEVIPLWIADMDFKTPDFIMNAIRERCNHEVLGYTRPCKEYFQSIQEWLKNRHQWEVEREWLGFVPGIVPGLAFCIIAFTNPGDKIVIQPPVYPPFHAIIRNNDRELVYNPLKQEDGKFKMDFEDLKAKFELGCKAMILCNPHNPGGKIWSVEELTELASLCKQYNVIVFSDEIHSDLALGSYKHHPFATVSQEAADNCITLMAPSKTFNMAGLGSSFYVISSPEIRERYAKFIENSDLANGHIFGFTATAAAYKNGEDWLNQCTEYLQNNVERVVDYVNKNIPQIKIMVPEASFLLWMDFSALTLSQQELVYFLLHEAKLGLNDGSTYGPGGEGYMRLNIGSPWSVLESALNNLKFAIENKLICVI